MSVPITACADRYPCYDRKGTRIKQGDRIRFQEVTGPYGQTRISETTVTQAHYEYGFINGARLSYRDGAMVGVTVHNDPEHGHETWIEVIT